MASEAYREYVEKLWHESHDPSALLEWANSPRRDETRELRRGAIQESGFLDVPTADEDEGEPEFEITFTPDIEWSL